jgi:PAS domain S-box-containing protein
MAIDDVIPERSLERPNTLAELRRRDFTRLVLEDAPIAIGVMEGPDHRFVLVNRQTSEITGLSEEQFLGRTHAEVVPEADKVVGPILDRVYSTGLSETQEIDVDLPSGRRQLLVTWTALPGGDGRPSSLLYLSLDITDRKRAEEALRANEEQFRAVAETAPDAIITIDEESTLLFTNQSTQKIFGYTLEELRGQQLTMLMPEYLRHLHQAGVKRYVETGQRHINWDAVEVPGLHKDGHEVPLEISFSEFVTKGERRFTGIIRDITDRKRAQEALKESERQLRILADAVPQLVWMAEPDGHIFWYNQRWYDYTGTTPEQMEGWGWQSVHDPEILPRVVERWKTTLDTGEPFEMEFPLKGTDGVFRWFLTRVNPLHDSQGRIVRWFGTNTDVDEQRRAAEELREANRLKDEFLATVSHELRTPLTAILGWAHLLRLGQLGERSATDALETIERNARAQSQLIDDLLDVSRIIAGKLRLDVSTVDLAQVIEAAVGAVRPAAEAKNMRLQVLLDPQVGPISGDADRLQQVVWNLLTNAVKFTPKGGRVQVRLERINSHVEIAVSDTGKGIDSEFLPHVFDRFRQADQKSTRAHGGLGLGLSIVRQLVELHGGSVHAESEGEGQGATFVVQLPLMVVRRGVEQQGRRHPTAGGSMVLDCPPQLDRLRILVVDDEEDTRDLLRTALEQCGSEVVTAGSAMEALEALEKSKPDVLISDIGMPEEDGYALIRKVRALSAARGGKVPAIALTAYARTEDRVRALVAGFQVHLPKPIEPVELVAVVASLVGRTGTA